jgi:hypothetical protein
MAKRTHKYADALVDPGLDSQLKELGQIADLAEDNMETEMQADYDALAFARKTLYDNQAFLDKHDLGGVVGMLNSDESNGGAIEAIGAVLIAYGIFAAFIYAVFLMASL